MLVLFIVVLYAWTSHHGHWGKWSGGGWGGEEDSLPRLLSVSSGIGGVTDGESQPCGIAPEVGARSQRAVRAGANCHPHRAGKQKRRSRNVLNATGAIAQHPSRFCAPRLNLRGRTQRIVIENLSLLLSKLFGHALLTSVRDAQGASGCTDLYLVLLPRRSASDRVAPPRPLGLEIWTGSDSNWLAAPLGRSTRQWPAPPLAKTSRDSWGRSGGWRLIEST